MNDKNRNTHSAVHSIYIVLPVLLWQYRILPPNPFKPEFTIIISIHYKPRIAVAILDLKN